jgi:hypothetical protein
LVGIFIVQIVSLAQDFKLKEHHQRLPEHFSAKEIERYKQRAMSPADLLDADDHLAVCQACRELVADREDEQTKFLFLKTGFDADANTQTHISYDQLAAYVDHVADEVDCEIIKSHLELCSSCTEEVEDLSAFRAEMQALPVKQDSSGAGWNFWQRFHARRRLPAYRFSLQAAGTGAFIMLVAWLAIIPMRKQVDDLMAQVSALQQANEALQQQGSTVTELRDQIAELQQSQVQVLGSSPGIALAFYDGGGLVTMDRQGALSGLTVPPALQQLVRTTLIHGSVRMPDLSGFVGKGGTLLSGASGGVPFGLIGPFGVVLDDRPTLRWQPLSGASSYVAYVYDLKFNRVAASGAQRGTEWTVSLPLERGVVYSWQVIAVRNGKEFLSPTPPAPEAKFKVLEQGPADEVARAKRNHANSHLVLGVLYAQSGLLSEAEVEFKALASSNPKSPIVQKLLKSVQAARRVR